MKQKLNKKVNQLTKILLSGLTDPSVDISNKQDDFITQFRNQFLNNQIPLKEFIHTLINEENPQTELTYTTLLNYYVPGFKTLSPETQAFLAINVNHLDPELRNQQVRFLNKILINLQKNNLAINSLPITVCLNSMLQFSALNYRAHFEQEKINFIEKNGPFPYEMEAEYTTPYDVDPYKCFNRFLKICFVFLGPTITNALLEKSSPRTTDSKEFDIDTFWKNHHDTFTQFETLTTGECLAYIMEWLKHYQITDAPTINYHIYQYKDVNFRLNFDSEDDYFDALDDLAEIQK